MYLKEIKKRPVLQRGALHSNDVDSSLICVYSSDSEREVGARACFISRSEQSDRGPP